MDNSVNEIKQKADIIEFIGQYVELKKAGRNYKGLCPFHHEKSPSFVVSPDRQLWRCFGACGEGGDVISFVMKFENITFFEALKELAEKTGVQLQKVSFEDKDWQAKEELLKMHIVAAEYYQYILINSPIGQKARDYLASRKLNDKLIHTFELGYAPDSWDSLLKFLKRKKFEEELMFKGGLLVQNENGHYYDRFRGRLMFPIKDIRTNITGFSGRTLDPKEKTAKYINSPETPIYHKRESLFGIHLAKDAIKEANMAILVEGEFDMISPYQQGIDNIVAIKGAAVTKEQLQILKRLTQKITLALDSDAAGEEAIKRGIIEAEKMEFDISVVTFDFGKDPDEAVHNDLIRFKKAIKAPTPIYDFLIQKAQKKFPEDTAFDKRKIGEDIIPFILDIKNPIVQSHYVRKLSNILEVSEDSIFRLGRAKRYEQEQTAEMKAKYAARKAPVKEEVLQKHILSYLFQHENTYEIATMVFGTLHPVDFSIPAYTKIVEGFLKFRETNNTQFNADIFISTLPSELQSVCNELYLYIGNEETIQRETIQFMVHDLKKISLKKRIADLMSDTPDSAMSHYAELGSYLKLLKEVEKKMNAL